MEKEEQDAIRQIDLEGKMQELCSFCGHTWGRHASGKPHWCTERNGICESECKEFRFIPVPDDEWMGIALKYQQIFDRMKSV